ncbi:MAG: efflux RND transporter permease subunit [Pseudomonadales bacterium]|nr:efflux RND transporter permease subunit [Pseudomonadales bacterium]
MLRFVIERGVILSVVIAIICLFGLVALLRVPVQMTPNIERPIISVRTNWPGATPQLIEAEILIEQEQYLRNLQGLIKMTSQANSGRASIDLEFAIGTSINQALLNVNNALSQVADYPENVDPPRLRTSASGDDPFIFFTLLAIDPETYQPGPAELTHIMEKYIQTPLERINGVAEVVVFGAVDRQVHLRVDPEQLAARGISIPMLRNAIRQRNRDISGGDIDSGKRRYVIRTKGRYESLQQIADTIIHEDNGHVVRVSDIGEVTLSSQELRAKGYINGQRSFPFGITRTAGTNVIAIFDAAESEITRLNDEVLKAKGLKIVRYADDVKYVKDAIKVVQKNLLIGAALACLVLYLFLHGFAPTLLGALGVPICTIGAFLGLLLTARTLNVISLAGVAFAIGMTLDNSIVVLENIFRHRAMGKNRFQAAMDGVSEVWTAVLASTLTTVFVFAPILLIEDEVGQLYSDIAIAISSAILMSMFVAVTVIPSVASRLSDQSTPEKGSNKPWLKPFIHMAGLCQHYFLGLLNRLLGSFSGRIITVAGTLIVCALIVIFMLPKAEYLPEGEENKIFAIMIPPPGYNMQEIDKASQSLDELILPHINADGSAFANGETNIPPMKYLMRVALPSRMFSISEPLSDDPSHADALKKALSEHMRAKPGMMAFANRGSIFSDNSGGTRSIQLDIIGPDLPAIYEAALLTYLKTKSVFDNAQIRPIPGLSLSQPAIEIHPNWERAAELGLNLSDLGYTIWALTDGAYVDDFFDDDEKIDIYLYSKTGNVTAPEDIADLPIYTESGHIIPLMAIADIEQTVSATTIRRVDARRAVTLNIIPPSDIPLEEAVEIVQQQVIKALQDDAEFADGVQIQIGGASDKLKNAQQALASNFLIAVVLSYLLMVAIFSHWGFPLIILLSIPLGVSGGIFGLWLMNNVFGINIPFDMITLLGMVVLIGIVVNNPILLLEQTRLRLAQGEIPFDAVFNSVKVRLRPIMMSMLTTIFGLAPVVFLPGAGTELYRGLGTIVLFGLLFSTLLTLIFIPALLSLLLDFRHKRQSL